MFEDGPRSVHSCVRARERGRRGRQSGVMGLVLCDDEPVVPVFSEHVCMCARTRVRMCVCECVNESATNL